MEIAIDAIIVGRGRRPTVAAKVKDLADSIRTIGLRIPISVLRSGDTGRYLLIAGRNRLEACRMLGWNKIAAEVMTDKLDAELWEIAENLHRSDLTAMQRNLALGRWVKLKAKKIKQDQRDNFAQLGRKSRGRPHETGLDAASRELGIKRTNAQRAVNIATGLTKRAQKEAERLGLDNNQRALERAAGLPGADEQVRALHRTVNAQNEKKEMKARIAENVSAASAPKTAKEAFERWYWSLDAELQSKVRIWLLQFDPSAFVSQLERVHEDIRAQASTLH